MNAAIYARISRGDDDAPDLQVRDARAEVARLGWSVVEPFVITEVESGRVSRDGIARLIAGAKRHAFDVVVIRALDRAARDIGLMLDALQALSAEGVQVYEYQARTFVPFDAPIDELMVSVKGFSAADYARSVGKNARATLVDKVRSGAWTGQREYGFTYERVGANTERRIDEGQAETIRRIYTLSDQGHGDLAIVKLLKGVPAPGKGTWSKDNVRGILRNPLYDGRPIFGTTKSKVKRVQKDETIIRKGRTLAEGEKYDARVRAPKAEWQEGTDPRIVQADLWVRVQARRAQTAAHFARNTAGQLQGKPESGLAPKHVLSRIGRC